MRSHRKGINMLEQIKKERFLRLTEVITRTGLSRSTIYRYISESPFPANISLGSNCVAWLESEIAQWIQSRINQRQF